MAKEDQQERRPDYIIYGHYDVQPLGRLVHGNPTFYGRCTGDYLFARGVSDMKGNISHASKPSSQYFDWRIACYVKSSWKVKKKLVHPTSKISSITR
jgi:hypothetical protein